MSKKKKTKTRTTIPQQVYAFLKRKQVALQKHQICNQMCLTKSAVNRACTILRKEKKVGYMRSCWGRFGEMTVKTYWGIK